MTNVVTVIFALVLSILIPILVTTGLGSNLHTYAQRGNETAETGTENMANATVPVVEKLIPTPGEKTLHLFTSEIENVNEDKLGVAGDAFSVHTIVVNKR